MLISYSMPAIAGSSITGGTWLTEDSAAALWDGKPARRARLQWEAGSAVDAYVGITVAFADATPLRVLALLGATLPAGVRVDFLGAGGDGLGGTCDNTRSTVMPDATSAAWAVARANDAAETGVEVRIYNDCNGVPWASDGTAVDLGELWAGPAVEAAHGADWSDEPEDPSTMQLTRGSQPRVARRSSYRVLDVPLVAASFAEVYAGGLANGMDWLQLRAALAGDARSVVVVRSATRFVAQYGVGRLGGIRHMGGNYFGGQLRHQEIPAR